MTDVEEMLVDLDRRLRELDERLNSLQGPHLNVTEGAVSPEGAVVEGPHLEFIEQTVGAAPPTQEAAAVAETAEEPLPGESLGDWVSAAHGSPGYVVDPGVARSGPCLRIALGEGHKALVYKRGIVGALDPEQQALYCGEGYVEREATSRQRARLEAMSLAAHTCSRAVSATEGLDRISAYFSCLGKELRAKGVEP